MILGGGGGGGTVCGKKPKPRAYPVTLGVTLSSLNATAEHTDRSVTQFQRSRPKHVMLKR